MTDPQPVQYTRLNLFQQVMALWEETGACNAAHVVRLRGRADVVALQSAIQIGCQTAGVGTLVLDLARGRHHFEPVESIQLQEIKGDGSTPELLRRTLTEQMNAPFPRLPHHPVRWLVLDDPQGDSHFLLVIWHHFPADDLSIRLLIRRVLNRYHGRLQPGDDMPLQVSPPDYARILAHHYRRLGYLRTFLRETRRYFQLRHVHRVGHVVPGRDASSFHLVEAPAGLVTRLAAACRVRRATVNDAILAALGAALAESTRHRRHHSRRRALALASAVNVRPYANQDLSACFGLYLGHWVTIIDQPDTGDLGQLLTRIAEQTRGEKAERRAVGQAWTSWLVIQLKRCLFFRATRAWYRKVYPITAGVSSVKLNAAWFKGAGDRLLDYIRISPAGPALPMGLAAAGLGDRLNLCLAYQPPALPESEAHWLVALFLRNLDGMARDGNPTAG